MFIDSYAEFAKCFDMKALYRFGLEHTIFVTPEEAKAQTAKIWEAWDNDDSPAIRRSKRSCYFEHFYAHGCQKHVAVKENNVPFRENLRKSLGFKSGEIKNFQCTHVFGRISNPILAGSVWNMAFSPNVVAAMTDDDNMGVEHFAEDYHALFMGVVWKLYKEIIKEYEIRASAVLQSVQPQGYDELTKEAAKKEWLIPNEKDVLAKYEVLCRDNGFGPDFKCELVTLDGRETNAIRIRFKGEK